MIALYVLLIEKGLKKIEEVPENIREEVKAKIHEMA